MENNRHTFASHHRPTVRPCLSHKLQTIHRTPLQKKKRKEKKEKKSRNIEQDDERLVSESVTLSQFRVKKHHKQNQKKGKIKGIRVVSEIIPNQITCNMSDQNSMVCLCVLGVTKPL